MNCERRGLIPRPRLEICCLQFLPQGQRRLPLLLTGAHGRTVACTIGSVWLSAVCWLSENANVMQVCHTISQESVTQRLNYCASSSEWLIALGEIVNICISEKTPCSTCFQLLSFARFSNRLLYELLSGEALRATAHWEPLPQALMAAL